jgi:hypothetical protein
VSWSAALLALLVSHAVGDVLLQTDRQARLKARGFEHTTGRRALGSHVASYMLAFLPALVWIGLEKDAVHALAVAVIVAVTHLGIDDGRLVKAWTRNVKRTADPAAGLLIAVDQTFHVLCLLGAALIAAI